MPMHDRVDADRQLTLAFVLGGGLRSWRAIGPTRARVVGVAQSRRRQHSQRWPDEQDFRSGAEHQLDVGRSAVPRLVRSATERLRFCITVATDSVAMLLRHLREQGSRCGGS
jgi:hypothetical protein